VRESDAEVVKRSLIDPPAFALIFDRYIDQVRRFVARRVTADDLDDVVAEVFRIAFERRVAFGDHYPSAAHWLFGVAGNVIRHRQRTWTRRAAAMRRLEGRASIELDPLLDAAARIDATTDAELLVSIVESLRPDDREALLLVAWEQMTPTEAALVLDVPAATVRTRLHRARQQIRHQLGFRSDGNEREVLNDGQR
jgi:RNA polymerase sigma-70 factor (ECF subfamily)